MKRQQMIYSLFPGDHEVIKWFVTTFPLVCHNRGRFLAEGHFWAEALRVRRKKQKTKNTIVSLEEKKSLASIYIMIPDVWVIFACTCYFLNKKKKRKEKTNHVIHSLSSATCSICTTLCRRTMSTSEPILISYIYIYIKKKSKSRS